jgi:hypothetical protein
MSLAALNWKYVGASAFVSATVAGMLDALYTIGTATTYADGTTRTEGSGSAWTFTGKRYQNAGVTEAVYPVPPTNTLNINAIFAGQAGGGVKTPTMASPDTSATAIVMASINKNSGAFSSWDSATPFTSGAFFGYWRMWPASAGTGSVYLWESQEALVVGVSAGTGMYLIMIGAFLDPESTDTVNDAESDGKLYGLMTTGTGALAAGTYLSSLSTATWTGHSGTNGNCHFGVFTPNNSTLLIVQSLSSLNVATTTTYKSRSGKIARFAIAVRATAASPNDTFIGRLREVFGTIRVQTPLKFANGGTTIGYAVSTSTTSVGDALLLLA